MSSKKSIFREESLNRLASPEELDRRLKITSSRAWLALMGIAVILGVAILWSFLGSIPTTVKGQGILLRTGGVFEVIATNSGQITDLSVRPDDLIESGQVIARVAQPQLDDQIDQVREQLDELNEAFAEVSSSFQDRNRLKRELKQLKEARFAAAIKSAEDKISYLEETIAVEEALYEDGLITQESLIATRLELNQAQTTIKDHQSRLEELKVEHAVYTNTRDEKLRDLRNEIEGKRRQLVSLERQRRLSENITSPYTGKVIDILKSEGRMVRNGEGIVRVELSGKEIVDLEVVFYVDPAQGKKIRGGMAAQVSPSTVEREKHGVVLGTVIEVSEHPATMEGMQNVLSNQSLIETLNQQGGAPIQARANLTPSKSTYSGYQWSSGEGPRTKLFTGTICDVTVTVDASPPITLVIPAIKRWLGIY